MKTITLYIIGLLNFHMLPTLLRLHHYEKEGISKGHLTNAGKQSVNAVTPRVTFTVFNYLPCAGRQSLLCKTQGPASCGRLQNTCGS